MKLTYLLPLLVAVHLTPFAILAPAANFDTPQVTSEKLATTGTASAYADTEVEAYEKAKKKVPDGAEEVSVKYNKSGGKIFCQIRWKK